MNTTKRPILEDFHRLQVEIEAMPASEQQTKVSIAMSQLRARVAKIEGALRDAISVYRNDDKTSVVTDERLEAWSFALAGSQHIHVSNRVDDRCDYCGFDLRHPIHIRQ
jgi:uncharacterized protein (DUF1684 family)